MKFSLDWILKKDKEREIIIDKIIRREEISDQEQAELNQLEKDIGGIDVRKCCYEKIDQLEKSLKSWENMKDSRDKCLDMLEKEREELRKENAELKRTILDNKISENSDIFNLQRRLDLAIDLIKEAIDDFKAFERECDIDEDDEGHQYYMDSLKEIEESK